MTISAMEVTRSYASRSRATGVAKNSGAKLTSSRAVLAVFSQTNGSAGAGAVGAALVAKEGITLGNDTTPSNQGYVRVASYKSSKGAPVWGGSNFGRNALVGVTANSNNVLKVNAATIYGDIAIGGENDLAVYNNVRARNLTPDQKDSDQSIASGKFVKNYTNDFQAPHVPAMDAGWTVVTPMDSADNSCQYRYSGKLSDLPKTVTAAKYSSGSLNVGSANSNTFVLGSSCDGLNTINVSGNVVLYFSENANLNNTTVHLNDGATLKMYFGGGVSSIPSTDSSDFSPSRYQINILPYGSAPQLWNTTAADIINGSLNAKIDTAAASPNASGPGVVVNYGSSGILNAVINAPYSDVQLSTGNKLGANQLRGSIVAKRITTTGGDFLDIFYDEDVNAGTSTSTSTEAALAGWREIQPASVPNS
jgi:hypothetical protein